MWFKEFNTDTFSHMHIKESSLRGKSHLIPSLLDQRALSERTLTSFTNSPRKGIRPLHLNFSPEPLLTCHPSELHLICSVGLQMVPREYYAHGQQGRQQVDWEAQGLCCVPSLSFHGHMNHTTGLYYRGFCQL